MNTSRRSPFVHHPVALSILLCYLVLDCILLLHKGLPVHHFATQAGIGAALGGATSNLVDRRFRGGVIDYIDIGFWPVFNLADVAISLGVPIALLSVW